MTTWELLPPRTQAKPAASGLRTGVRSPISGCGVILIAIVPNARACINWKQMLAQDKRFPLGLVKNETGGTRSVTDGKVRDCLALAK